MPFSHGPSLKKQLFFIFYAGTIIHSQGKRLHVVLIDNLPEQPAFDQQ